jgi:hypothetical protein
MLSSTHCRGANPTMSDKECGHSLTISNYIDFWQRGIRELTRKLMEEGDSLRGGLCVSADGLLRKSRQSVRRHTLTFFAGLIFFGAPDDQRIIPFSRVVETTFVCGFDSSGSPHQPLQKGPASSGSVQSTLRLRQHFYSPKRAVEPY